VTNNTTAQEGLPALAPSARPGALVVWSAGRPLCVPYELSHVTTRIGRDAVDGISFPQDNYLSREHGSISYLAGGWLLEALKPAYLDGVRFEGRRSVDGGVVRFGQTILLLLHDLSPFDRPTEIVSDYVVSAALRAAFEDAARASVDRRNLLILAPTGAGKERVARAYHERGPRSNGPFVVVDATNLVGDTALSQLFGSKKGAFTGALDSAGLIAGAHGGTVFLDELGDLALDVQAAVLRAFQERTILAVGSTTPRKVDFALVAATNVDLEDAVARARFRADLLGRLEERVVLLEGIDQRRSEIPFLVELAVKKQDPKAQIDASFVEACLLRSFPRNVRGVLNLADAAASLARTAGRAIGGSDVEPLLARRPSKAPPAAPAPPPPVAPVAAADEDDERRSFVETYRLHNGDEAAVMAALNISRATFYARKKKYGLGRR